MRPSSWTTIDTWITGHSSADFFACFQCTWWPRPYDPQDRSTGRIARRGGIKPLETFTHPDDWQLTECLTCTVQAHYRFLYSATCSGVRNSLYLLKDITVVHVSYL
jgi:hypothetical protein